jgi:hypothetical protein
MEVPATTLINHDNWPVSWRGYLHCLVYSALQRRLSAWRTRKAMQGWVICNRTSLYWENKDQGIETWQQSCSWHYHLCNYRCICKCNVVWCFFSGDDNVVSVLFACIYLTLFTTTSIPTHKAYPLHVTEQNIVRKVCPAAVVWNRSTVTTVCSTLLNKGGRINGEAGV